MGVALPFTTSSRIAGAERSELVELFKHYRSLGNEWVKRQILDNNRVDILFSYVLGYTLTPLHLAILKYAMTHPDSLQLVFRGAGKSSAGTETLSIFYLLKDPNLRIVLASKTAGNAQGFLKGIKNQFENNDKLREIFGVYYDASKMEKWDEGEIRVLPRTSPAKEASITCVGVGQTIVSKHYDILFGDDLIDEDNSATLHMRDKTSTWYYKTLEPTLEPKSPDVPHRGNRHIYGTRYHYDDQYGRWIEKEYADKHQIIPALNENLQSAWQEKWPVAELLRRKENAGLVVFNSQWQCDTEAMKGEIFQYDDCQMIDWEDVPSRKKLSIYIGIDLAISQKDSADKFAIVTIGVCRQGNIYVLDCMTDRLTFKKQTDVILKFAKKWSPLRSAIESNGYQAAQAEVSEEKATARRIEVNLRKRETITDKIARAWKLQPKFESKRMYFVKNRTEMCREQLVMFPSLKLKDLFDALDHAVWASKRRRRTRREPGVI